MYNTNPCWQTYVQGKYESTKENNYDYYQADEYHCTEFMIVKDQQEYGNVCCDANTRLSWLEAQYYNYRCRTVSDGKVNITSITLRLDEEIYGLR